MKIVESGVVLPSLRRIRRLVGEGSQKDDNSSSSVDSPLDWVDQSQGGSTQSQGGSTKSERTVG